MQSTAFGLELASTFAKEFSVSSRNRGDEYFRLKRVKVHIGASVELSATVNGSEPYEVLLKVTGSKLAVSCSCPYFLDQGQSCKHLWAAILTADEQGYLSDAAAGKGFPSILTPSGRRVPASFQPRSRSSGRLKR